MDKKTLNKYKRNKKELALLDKAIDRLEEALAEVPVISGKVSGSSSQFPYTEIHTTVQMEEPKPATKIRIKILKKQSRKEEILSEMAKVESFIESLPEGEERQIFELSYYERMSQEEIGETIGYSQGRVSQIIKKYTED